MRLIRSSTSLYEAVRSYLESLRSKHRAHQRDGKLESLL
jgi:hypothetical protein